MKNDDRIQKEMKERLIFSGLSRREFISSVALGSAGVLIGGCSKNETVSGPDTKSDENSNPVVATADCFSYDKASLDKQVAAMFEQIGGLSDIIKPGDTVGIKINLTAGVSQFNKVPNPPFELYLTHPQLTRTVCELVKDAGAGKIYIIEAISEMESFTYQDPACGLSFKNVADEMGATLLDLNESFPYNGFIKRTVPNGLIYNEFFFNGVFNEIDCLISLPKAKKHRSAGITHAMKNLVGTLPTSAKVYNDGKQHRAAIHSHPNGNDDLCRVILDLNAALPIQLTVTDAIWTTTVAENPENGDLVQSKFNKLLAAKHDMVAADAVASEIIGFNPAAADNSYPFSSSLNYLRLAETLGRGVADLAKIDVVDATAA